ncbi:MAG: BatD family protein [Candidatus Symbiothrix sp.]|jgi:tetratricopeptide (TPR) repeat protein|nr:BatD family protein [Candidatus Symbiothrix sp.]
MKRLKFLLTLCLLLTAHCSLLTAQVSLRGNAPQAVVVGEQFRVSYTLTTSGEKGSGFQIADVKGLQLLFGPALTSQGSSISIINGNQTTQITNIYSCTFLADQAGDYTIPAASIKVGNNDYKSNSLKIKVLPADQAAAAAASNQRAAQAQTQNGASGEATPSVPTGDIFVRTIVGNPSPYENEGIPVTFKIYSASEFGVENIKFPDFEGFIVQEVELPTDRQILLENYNGRNYRTVVLRQVVLYPQHTGKLTINAGKADAVVRVRTQPQGRRSIFDDFIGTYSDVKKTIGVPAATVTAKPLPEGKPAGFSGAVGSYKLTSSISTNSLKANESVTIKITISGTGNIKMVKNPEIVFPNDFETYDPKIDIQTKVSSGGVSGTKTIEYYAVPRYAGDFTIPATTLSYFDLASGTYKTLATEEYQLHVEPGAPGSSAPIISGANKEDVRFVGQDIRHIKTTDFKFHKGDYFFGSLGYWLCYLVPFIVFAILFIVYRKQVKANRNIALQRTKKANKVATKRLKTAKQHLKAYKKEAFYDEILKAVWGYLSDKLNIPVANLTKENVEADLSNYGASPELIQQFTNILNTAEFARFAPGKAGEAMDELYNTTVNAINQMETINLSLRARPAISSTIGGPRVKHGMTTILLLVLSLTAFAQIEQGNEAYTAGDYEQAVQRYETALATNGESAAVYYNLGNAYYRLNKVAPAILNYERALLLNPSDKDTRFNLEMAKLKTVDKIDNFGNFFLFEWWNSVQNLRTSDQWGVPGIVFFVLFLVCLAVYFFSRKISYKKIAFFTGLAALILCLFANIFAYNQQQKLTNKDTAIIFAATTTIKSAPDTSGTDLFILHEGTKVKITNQLGNWREIETADGNKGWIQTNEIKVI